MVTPAQMRKLALSFPEAEERSHHGHPDFRVMNKIFAGLAPDGVQGTLKLSPEAQQMVLDANPAGFKPAAGAWGRSGWTMVVLEHVQSGELRALLAQAWRGVAPKKLLGARAPGEDSSPKKSASKRAAATKSSAKPARAKKAASKPRRAPAR